MIRLFLLVFGLHATLLFSDNIPIQYQLMDRGVFEDVVVGNTIVGVTRQSHSLYMLYFLPDGCCELWKQNQIYVGNWWIETDDLGRDIVRAFWPQYVSSDSNSLFSPQNPRYGTATSIRYYVDPQHGAVFLAGKKFMASVILAPGCAFPNAFTISEKVLK